MALWKVIIHGQEARKAMLHTNDRTGTGLMHFLGKPIRFKLPKTKSNQQIRVINRAESAV
jgi:hypothetical protein